ncbi:hypothetical protein NTE_00127 [Candidatus Nitrososphaera evergladensis SR1]|uniref:Uncharacterized protein n=1 Tax=Candidatus Nitrososphaera evergladensis SR1 TaxID=1459636 RepID=A0A075MS31_9ARCH|nr:hypothetical protein NTE_00127 [Candidatus Nitrososphaera evergladensis SR1]
MIVTVATNMELLLAAATAIMIFVATIIVIIVAPVPVRIPRTGIFYMQTIRR